jgi:hypothetical protein
MATIPNTTKWQASSRAASVVSAVLIALFLLQILLAVRKQAQTNDEAFHLYAGYRYLQCGDFAINPEHPPLVKLVAGLALRVARTPAPAGVCGQESSNKFTGFGAAFQYLYKDGNDADAILLRARTGVAVFSLLLALACWALARQLYGDLAAMLALAWLAFEPNLLAHGALVTTDVAVSAFMLATVWSFYRYWQGPSAKGLIIAGLLCGFTLAAKHSGVLILPTILLLCAVEFLMRRTSPKHLAAAALAIFAIAYVVLWAVYGFRYWPRPNHAALTMSLEEFLLQVRAQGTHGLLVEHLIPFMARWHLAPLAYLYGFVDVLNISSPGQPPFILGHVYPHGKWFFFPVSFVIKSTIGMMAILVIAIVISKSPDSDNRRKLAYVSIPVMLVFGIGMTSGLNIGYRHVLPIIGFLCVLCGSASAWLWSNGTRWRYAPIILLAAHVASSALTYPNYIPYANEMFGRAPNTYRYLTDANADWAQALIQTRDWLKKNGIEDCWFAYDGISDPEYYGIPCRRLPGNQWDAQEPPPDSATGIFVISPLSLSGIEWEPGDLHPYRKFWNTKPIANVANGMLVYRGTFDLKQAAAVARIARANGDDDPEDALVDAKQAVAATPTSVRAHLAMALALENAEHYEDAQREYEAALIQAHRTGDEWYPNEIAAAQTAIAKLK